ncbi:DUF3300 domain-containing protein [Thiovibrio sp. JS02]
METSAVFRIPLGLLVIFCSFFSLFMSPQPLSAQDSDPTAPDKYSREELAQMLAPIALYPDTVLSQILMASTYPIEVVEADRWTRKNPNLKGETLNTVLLDKQWSPSVKALCHFPQILALMSERISETTNIGNAFLAQEAEVMDMVQELRAKAVAQGNLATSSQQKVVVEKETIIIKPADPTVIHVPYYDPFRVYGPWWYPAYPPHYWGPPGVSISVGISYWPGIYFGFVFGNWCYFDWHRHYIYVDVHRRPRFVRHEHWYPTPGRWQHDPRHRRGVAYYDKATARKYGQSFHRAGDYRHDTRGGSEQGDRERERERLELERRKHERVEGERKERRTRSEVDSREGMRLEPERQKQERVESDRNKGRTGREVDKQERQRLELEKHDRVSDESQRQERTRSEPSQRGSRQGRGDDSGDGGRSDRDSRGRGNKW